VIIAGAAMALGGSLIVALGRAAERGLLSPNGWVGIRTPATVASREGWYAAHEAGGRWISIGGWILTVGGIVILVIRRDDADAARIALLSALLTGAAVVYGGYLGHRAAVALQGSDGTANEGL